MNGSTGEHGILASGVRNSFDGVWVPNIGYVFTDNGRDWEGDHPDEELNLLSEGGAIMDGQMMTPPTLFLKEASHQSQLGLRIHP